MGGEFTAGETLVLMPPWLQRTKAWNECLNDCLDEAKACDMPTQP